MQASCSAGQDNYAVPAGHTSQHCRNSVQVRRLINNLRMTSNRHPASGSVSPRETSVVEACQVLTTLVTESADRKPIFLAEDGVIALLELLEERSTKVSSTCARLRLAVYDGQC